MWKICGMQRMQKEEKNCVQKLERTGFSFSQKIVFMRLLIFHLWSRLVMSQFFWGSKRLRQTSSSVDGYSLNWPLEAQRMDPVHRCSNFRGALLIIFQASLFFVVHPVVSAFATRQYFSIDHWSLCLAQEGLSSLILPGLFIPKGEKPPYLCCTTPPKKKDSGTTKSSSFTRD